MTTAAPDFVFPSIKGGDFRLGDWRGKPVLVVNTASMCGFTPQYAGMQALADLLGPRGVVLAVPSDDFEQEYGSEAEVARRAAEPAAKGKAAQPLPLPQAASAAQP